MHVPVHHQTELPSCHQGCGYNNDNSWATYAVPRGPLAVRCSNSDSLRTALENACSSLKHFVTSFAWRAPVQTVRLLLAESSSSPHVPPWFWLVLSNYFLTCIGLKHLIHSPFLPQEKTNDLGDRRYCKGWCCHKSESSLLLSPLSDTRRPCRCFCLPGCSGAHTSPRLPS